MKKENKVMTIKEIREKLQVSGTKFNINGKLSYQKGPDGGYGDYPAVLFTLSTIACTRMIEITVRAA